MLNLDSLFFFFFFLRDLFFSENYFCSSALDSNAASIVGLIDGFILALCTAFSSLGVEPGDPGLENDPLYARL